MCHYPYAMKYHRETLKDMTQWKGQTSAYYSIKPPTLPNTCSFSTQCIFVTFLSPVRDIWMRIHSLLIHWSAPSQYFHCCFFLEFMLPKSSSSLKATTENIVHEKDRVSKTYYFSSCRLFWFQTPDDELYHLLLKSLSRTVICRYNWIYPQRKLTRWKNNDLKNVGNWDKILSQVLK